MIYKRKSKRGGECKKEIDPAHGRIGIPHKDEKISLLTRTPPTARLRTRRSRLFFGRNDGGGSRLGLSASHPCLLLFFIRRRALCLCLFGRNGGVDRVLRRGKQEQEEPFSPEHESEGVAMYGTAPPTENLSRWRCERSIIEHVDASRRYRRPPEARTWCHVK
jgi:hypothetical protein